MRKEIFLAICNQIKQHVPEVKFIDLWNEHLAEITTGSAWPTPSVFVEFEQYEVRQMANRARVADVPVRLHIIDRAQNYNGSDDQRMNKAIAYFDLIDKVNAAMAKLSGDNFSTFMLTASATNHNHAELIENIERHVCRAQDLSAVRIYQQKPVDDFDIIERV